LFAGPIIRIHIEYIWFTKHTRTSITNCWETKS